MGIGNASVGGSGGFGGYSASGGAVSAPIIIGFPFSNLYVEPGVLVMVPLGIVFVGADASALILPGVGTDGAGDQRVEQDLHHGQLPRAGRRAVLKVTSPGRTRSAGVASMLTMKTTKADFSPRQRGKRAVPLGVSEKGGVSVCGILGRMPAPWLLLGASVAVLACTWTNPSPPVAPVPGATTTMNVAPVTRARTPDGSAGGSVGFDRGATALGLSAVDVSGCKTPGGPSGAGRVMITFSSNGSVTSATVDTPTFAGTPTGECVANQFRAVRVRPFSGSVQVVGKMFRIE